VLAARPSGVSVEGANPRHEHEWAIFAGRALPADTVLIPGMLDSTTNYIEHPELVAQRIGRYADVAGRERVIAGTDCGFATFAGMEVVDPSIAWAKLAALSEGARLASDRLWKRRLRVGTELHAAPRVPTVGGYFGVAGRVVLKPDIILEHLRTVPWSARLAGGPACAIAGWE
jgi:hypothetical protein